MELLLVEDDRVIATGLFYSLTQEGYAVTACHSCEEARVFKAGAEVILTSLEYVWFLSSRLNAAGRKRVRFMFPDKRTRQYPGHFPDGLRR